MERSGPKPHRAECHWLRWIWLEAPSPVSDFGTFNRK